MLHLALSVDTNAQRVDLQALIRTLWKWPSCDLCHHGARCPNGSCPWRRKPRLTRFSDHCQAAYTSYLLQTQIWPNAIAVGQEDLICIIEAIRSSPEKSRQKLIDEAFGGRLQTFGVEARGEALDVAVNIAFMVKCASRNTHSAWLEDGTNRDRWKSEESLASFVLNLIPNASRSLGLSVEDSGSALDIKTTLKARKLEKRAGLRFRPTNDWSDHLRVDRNNGRPTVLVFNQIAFLKEQLRLTKDAPRLATISDWLRMGALPRDLVLECLDSIQKVLFPLTDKKSRVLLRSLISKHGFDPEMLNFESVDIRNVDEREITYLHFGSRLADLADDLENPKPQSWMEKWFERKSGARYLMMATLIGAAIAVLLGIASLALGGYQAWIGYQQWKHPVG